MTHVLFWLGPSSIRMEIRAGREPEAEKLIFFIGHTKAMTVSAFFFLDSLCSEKQLEARDHQLPRTKPLPSVESLGPPPAKPPKPPVVDLQIFQKQLVVVSQDAKEGTGNCRPSTLPASNRTFCTAVPRYQHQPGAWTANTNYPHPATMAASL